MSMIGDKKSRQAELGTRVEVWGDRIGEDNAVDYQRALWQGQTAFVVILVWLAFTIVFQLMRIGWPIAVVTLLTWPVMLYLYTVSVRGLLRVSVAVLNRYGLPSRGKWNVPLKRTEDFDRWLARRMDQPH